MRYQYWEADSTYRRTPSSSNPTKKIIAALVIIILMISSGIILMMQNYNPFTPGTPTGEVKVAVLDSGLDIDFSMQGRVAEQQSFILPMYGYEETDTSTTDSNPSDGAGNNVKHGTLVTQAVLQESQSAIIVNAKVIGSDGVATARGIEAAIYWAIEVNCSIINLSVGSSPTYGDPLERAVDYAFSQGVVVVAAAGNEGGEGLAGTSISSPSLFRNALSVAALDQNGIPEGYSSTGPIESRYMKPDIAAPGYVETPSARYFGTSFASPRVAGIAADLINYLDTNGINHTPGMIYSALMLGAESIAAAEYVVGAGEADLQGAIDVLQTVGYERGFAEIAYAHPNNLPIDYEQLFYGDLYFFDITIFNSQDTTYSVSIESETPEIFDIPITLQVNQSGVLHIELEVPDSGTGSFESTILLEATYHSTSVEIDFSAEVPDARIAFDTSHSAWSIDSIYGQFRDFYIELTDNDISVTEIRNSLLLTYSYLSDFDAVFILDPCSWDINETIPSNPEWYYIPYTQAEKDAYIQYYNSGGGIFVAGLSNESINIDEVNSFLDWTGISFDHDTVPGDKSITLVTNLSPHPVTSGIPNFDYAGTTLNHNATADVLATLNGEPVLVSIETAGRIIVTGTNFFIDNWGINGIEPYQSSSNAILGLRIALWLADMI